jgi:hypothetical protein
MTSSAKALIFTCLLANCLAGATDPFVGKWKAKMPPSDGASTGMTIEKAGPHAYKFPGGVVLVDDGREVRDGGISMLKQEGPNVWRWIHKPPPEKQGYGWNATITLSSDGQTLVADSDYTEVDGSHHHDKFEDPSAADGRNQKLRYS